MGPPDVNYKALHSNTLRETRPVRRPPRGVF